jgi:hypothetical protein
MSAHPTVRYRKALDGIEPAETLTTAERERLIRVLMARGWTDFHIAMHTLWSVHTVIRIRERLGLKPNVAERSATAS